MTPLTKIPEKSQNQGDPIPQPTPVGRPLSLALKGRHGDATIPAFNPPRRDEKEEELG